MGRGTRLDIGAGLGETTPVNRATRTGQKSMRHVQLALRSAYTARFRMLEGEDA